MNKGTLYKIENEAVTAISIFEELERNLEPSNKEMITEELYKRMESIKATVDTLLLERL